MSRIPVASLANGTLLTSVPFVSAQNPTGAPMLTPLVGASVLVFTHDSTTPVSVWSTETSNTALVQPLLSGSDGTVPGWIDQTSLPADLVVGGQTFVLTGGGGGSGSVGVDSFNTRIGPVTLAKTDVTATGLAAADVGADVAGAAATVQTALNAETVRAEAVESTNAAAITAETTRATAAENAKAPLASPTFTGTPKAPTRPALDNSQNLATTAYVDAATAASSAGLVVHNACDLGTANALPTNTYLSGVLTATANGALSVDGIAVTVNNRVLVKSEGTPANNGIYTVTQTGNVSTPYILTRATDMDAGTEIPGAFAFVSGGNTLASSGWAVSGAGPFTLGTTAINWTLFSQAGQIVAGTGLTKTGNTLAVNYGTDGVTAAAGNDSRITGALQGSNNLSDLANGATARTNLGLGSAATQSSSAFDAAGAAAAATTALTVLPSSPADQARQTSGVTYRGGELKTVYEELNALDGYLTANSVSQQGAALQTFINTVGHALGGGGSGVIPTGVYDISDIAAAGIALPANVQCHIRGENSAVGWPFGYGTVLKTTVDTTSAPDSKALFKLPSSGSPFIGNMTLLGPGGTAGVAGIRPAALAALNMLGSSTAACLNIEGFSSAILLGGPGKNSDHISLEDINTNNVGFGIYQLPSVTYGDIKLKGNFRLAATLAAMGCASSSNGFGGVWVNQAGFYAPYGFFRLDDGSYGGTFLDGINHFACNVEEPAHGFAFDEQWNGGNGIAGNIFDCNFSAGSVQNPAGGSTGGWNAAFACTVSGATVTITTNTGFVFRKNMLASGTGWSGQTITAISSTATNNWAPPGTSVTYTLTMSGAPTGTPTTVTLSMPTRATIAAGSLSDCEFGYSIGGQTGVVAPFVVAPLAVHDNRLSDGAAVKIYHDAGQPFVDPASGSVFSQSFVFGNKWGSDAPGSPLYTSMQAVDATTISLNDLVEVSVTSAGSRRVQRAQGTGVKTIGVAKQATSTGHPAIDIQGATSGTVGATTQVNNKTASTIPIATRIKVDALNPGGITPVTAASDLSVGVTTAAILPGASGPAVIDIATFGVASGPSGGSGTGGSGAYSGASITPALDGSGNLALTIASEFGIDPATGFAYFNGSGATSGQEAILQLNSDGTLSLTQIQGQVP